VDNYSENDSSISRRSDDQDTISLDDLFQKITTIISSINNTANIIMSCQIEPNVDARIDVTQQKIIEQILINFLLLAPREDYGLYAYKSETDTEGYKLHICATNSYDPHADLFDVSLSACHVLSKKINGNITVNVLANGYVLTLVKH
jgi:hypothetical protein